MKLFFLKLFIALLITTATTTSNRFNSIIKFYSFEECSILKSFPKSDLPIAIRSESQIFNRCYKSIRSSNIKVIDRVNEAKVLGELAHQSTIPTNNIIEIGDLITPQYIVTELVEKRKTRVKLTSVKTGVITWEQSSSTPFLGTYSKEIIIGFVYIIVLVCIQIATIPYKRHIQINKKIQAHKEMYSIALKKIKAENISEGIDMLIRCSNENGCQTVKDNSLKKLKLIKENLGVS